MFIELKNNSLNFSFCVLCVVCLIGLRFTTGLINLACCQLMSLAVSVTDF